MLGCFALKKLPVGSVERKNRLVIEHAVRTLQNVKLCYLIFADTNPSVYSI